MTIRRVSRLRDCGVFRDFVWPADLEEFDRFNLIYGWNGCGKTTLSRLLRSLEHRTRPSMGHAVVRIGDCDVKGGDFPGASLHIRVFNRDFVNDSVFAVGGGAVPPIFVIGKDNVEKQRRIEQLAGDLEAAQSALVSHRGRLSDAERALEKTCIDRAKLIKDTLRSPTPHKYDNYDKSNFSARAQQMAEDGDAASRRLSEADRVSLLSQHQSTPKPTVPLVRYAFPELELLAVAVSEVLSTTVVSATIPALKDDPTLAEWARSGLTLHRDRQLGSCLFCGQPLPGGCLPSLEAHFSAAYEQLMSRLGEMAGGLEAASKEAEGLRLPNRAELYDDLTAEYDNAARAVQEGLEATREFLGGLILALQDKRTRPFDRLSLNVRLPAVDGDAVERLNLVVGKHNDACAAFRARLDSARERLALDMIAEAMGDFSLSREAASHAAAEVRAAAQLVQQLSGEISALEREIRQHQQPAEELNADLRGYLGHGELQLAIKETGYAITRNEVPAQMLSEGETTAISLLYFLKSLEDRALDLQDGVVVLDDPVSSLDQNVLFAAFGYIRSRTQAAGQVLVLTHNFLFFRLVREWFKNLRGEDKKAYRVFMLECSPGATGRQASIRKIDQLLLDFDSEYHYLFARLHDMAMGPAKPSLEAYYSAPSIARRVVETFLAFRFPDQHGPQRLWSQMQAVPFDEAKRSRIYRFIQTHSHRDAVGDGDDDMTLLGESRAVLGDVLSFLQTADPDHISRMLARIGVPEREARR